MAAPPLSELEPMLASLNQLKPPGASKNKIGALTQIAVQNIQAEQHITQCLYRALKKAPATHKLGALYVIDSIVRQWIDHAKKANLDLNIDGRGEPGTYPAAVKRITELMPALFDDLIKDLPADQKSKLENIIAIWERGNTFPASVLAESKQKLLAPQSAVHVNGAATAQARNHGKPGGGERFMAPIPTRPVQTPTGYPPQRLYDQGLIARQGEPARSHDAGSLPQVPAPVQHQQPAPQPAAPAQDVNSILAALRNAAPPAPQPIAQQSAPPAMASQLPPELAAMFGAANGFASNQPIPQQIPPPFQPPPSQPLSFPMGSFQPPAGFPGFPPQPPPSIPQQWAQAPPPPQPMAPAADPLAPLRSILPASIVNDQQKLVKALNLLQELQNENVPMQEWGPVLQALDEQDNQPSPQQQQQYGAYDGYGRNRGRSRSPERDRRAGGRGSPVYGAYEGPKQDDMRNGRGGGRDKNRFRQRSPMRNSPRPTNGGPPGPKFIAHDNSMPPDHIRVLSRTLFVGGANGTQQEISDLFGRFGAVASCIPNRDKRHAFVKMTTREYTLNAKQGVEALQNANDRDTMAVARQTKWGVGFGPRECFDYSKGESVIPIHRLTEADVKWMKNAEYGGTGGRELESGMVLEEPDIEIGAGVSSKAMSKRVVPDAGGHGSGGGHGGNGGGPPPKRHEGKGRKGKHQHHYRDDVGGGYNGSLPGGFARPEPLAPVAVATPPAVPGFGFTLPGGFR